jgi:hypothetical protein
MDYLDTVIDWSQRIISSPAAPSRSAESVAESILEYSIIGGAVAYLIGRFCHRKLVKKSSLMKRFMG